MARSIAALNRLPGCSKTGPDKREYASDQGGETLPPGGEKAAEHRNTREVEKVFRRGLDVPVQFAAAIDFGSHHPILYVMIIYKNRLSNQVDGDSVHLERLSASSGFEWVEGNSEKNWFKHGATRSECEQVFFNLPFVVADDQKHSHDVPRHYALGQTDKGRKLFIVFTIRDSLIRVISARNMHRAERRIYDEKENSEIRE
jgi:uncharacterized DUF497 family protein